MSTSTLARRWIDEYDEELGLEDAAEGWSDEEVVDNIDSPLLRVIGSEESSSDKLVKAAVEHDEVAQALDGFVQALAETHPFSPLVRFGDDSRVYVRLPEFGVYSEGGSFDEAAWGLVDEVLQYVSDWEKRLEKAPNHSDRRGWVRRIQLSRSPERVYRMLFGRETSQ